MSDDRAARVLVSGIDTLGVFSRSAVTMEWQGRLSEAKRWAEDGGTPVDFEVGAHRFKLKPGRARTAPYILESEPLAVLVAPAAPRGFPQVSAELRSAMLWKYGARSAVDRTRRLFEVLTGFSGSDLGVTRADLAVDFQGFPFEFFDAPRFKARSRVDVHGVDPCTGFSWGTTKRAANSGAAPLVARLYNKSEEIRSKSPDKAWFIDVWAESPRYRFGEDTWRLEFQLRRKGFRSFAAAGVGRLDSWADLEGHARALWAFLSSRWVHIPGKRTMNKWNSLHPSWEPLSREGFADSVWRGFQGDLTRLGRSNILRRCAGQFGGFLAREYALSLTVNPDATHDEAIWDAVRRAEAECERKGTDLDSKGRERAALHFRELENLRSRLPPRDPTPIPPPPRLAEPPPCYDTTPAQPELHLGA